VRAAARVFRLVHEVAVHVALERGYAKGTTQVSFFVPSEVVAATLGMSRSSLYRNLHVLKATGLVDYRGHKTTISRGVRSDGTVWSVRLHVDRSARARLRYEDLKQQYRDLQKDIDEGRTAYQQLQDLDAGQSNPLKEEGGSKLKLILDWALAPVPTPAKSTLTLTVPGSPTGGLELLLDVPSTPRKDRADMVDAAARAISTALGDSITSLNCWRWLVWRLLELQNAGADYFYPVYNMVQRAAIDHREKFAKSAGALLIQRLKEEGIWDQLKQASSVREAAMPAGQAIMA